MRSRKVALPSAPTNHRLPQVVQWTRQPEYAVARLEEYLAWTLVLPEVPAESRPVEEHRAEFADSEVSYLGGPSMLASADDWPRNAQGKPLAHVMTLALCAVSAGSATDEVFHSFPGARMWLPTTGTLEVFHDLETYGWEPEERAMRGVEDSLP
ncbi:DUF1963 domain-containing protein [Jonesia quinghaiensis]|uniref:DUF1963 domain-containing protein n=1 Tax=Jonesia quinghaiensis TaxID=262806 RepID=UPI000490E804|nr:DUF1963 domain-containing protein [Jonesia quinghaiensis]